MHTHTAIATITALLFAPALAQAQDNASDDGVAIGQESVRAYFDGEKRGAIGFMGVGAASLITGTALVLSDNRVAKWTAAPTLTLGALELAIGALVYGVADGRADRAAALAEEDLAAFKSSELERIGLLDSTFTALYAVETALILGGLSAAVIGKINDNDPMTGIGLGIATQTPFILVLDAFADRRGEIYMEALNGIEIDEDGAPQPTASLEGGAIGLRLTF